MFEILHNKVFITKFHSEEFWMLHFGFPHFILLLTIKNEVKLLHCMVSRKTEPSAHMIIYIY